MEPVFVRKCLYIPTKLHGVKSSRVFVWTKNNLTTDMKTVMTIN